jgi:integrase/recombinase XerD
LGKLSKQNPDQTLIEMWLHNRPDSTQEAYRGDVDNFFEFVAKPLQQVTLEELQAYSTNLDEQDLKPSSIRRKLNAIKSLFTFATKLNYTRFNVAAALRIPKGNRLLSGRILKQIEVLKLINHPELTKRDRALLKLLTVCESSLVAKPFFIILPFGCDFELCFHLYLQTTTQYSLANR